MRLVAPPGPFRGEVELPISKSIANRYLMLSALAKTFPNPFLQGGALSVRATIGGMRQLSPLKEGVPRSREGGNIPEDVRTLLAALESDAPEINIGMAGTAMRFLTAFYAVQEGKTVTLTGDERMKQRPIGLLVEALQTLGSDIQYLENEGFPPLRISGKKLNGGEVEIDASTSSQFISALMMIGPMMKNGLKIILTEKILSKPYIHLTADCMMNCGVAVKFEGNSITVPSSTYRIPELKIESDWTSASYFYALAAVRPNSKLLLKGLNISSVQGDSILVEWLREMGVTSIQKDEGVEISSSEKVQFPSYIDFTHHPDLAQTFAFLAATLGKPLVLIGLENLRLKETDRVKALKWELKNLGISVSVRGESMSVFGSISAQKAYIKTYNDHRMAMSGAILAAKIPVDIENPNVVAKSFPGFWESIIALNRTS